jgi:hypothetical protein
MKITIMQPYFFPYLGYFQMVQAADTFVFYDDVQFIKGGWINRNRILVNKTPTFFSAQLVGASSNKLINEVGVMSNDKVIRKTLNTISQNYSKAPFFNAIFPIVEEVYRSESKNIAELAALSVTKVADYLELVTCFEFSSNLTFGHNSSDKAERIVEICHGFNANTYINATGGKALYSKEFFAKRGIDLFFIEGALPEYNQGTKDFFPGMSMVDVLMHNDKAAVLKMLNSFQLV